MNKYIVGAYAASPCTNGWDPVLEAAFLSALRKMPLVGGLEIPFYGTLHPHDDAFFLGQMQPEWNHLLTLIPGTMDRLKADPAFGLASTAESGRKAAVEFVSAARREVARANHHWGRRSFLGVEIHSAPTRTSSTAGSSKEAFAESLREISSWDWDGAELFVEHCDAFVPGQVASKGFLDLADEVSAIESLSKPVTPVSVLINWGRSAIEGRKPDRAVEHIRFAKEHHLLKGLIFSGCAEQDEHHGNWRDSHAPFARSAGVCFGAAGSLLTKSRAAVSLSAAGPSDLLALGFKMQPLPKSTGLEDRIGLIKETLEILNERVYQSC